MKYLDYNGLTYLVQKIKTYVDDHAGSGTSGNYLPLSGGTLTGNLHLNNVYARIYDTSGTYTTYLRNNEFTMNARGTGSVELTPTSLSIETTTQTPSIQVDNDNTTVRLSDEGVGVTCKNNENTDYVYVEVTNGSTSVHMTSEGLVHSDHQSDNGYVFAANGTLRDITGVGSIENIVSVNISTSTIPSYTASGNDFTTCQGTPYASNYIVMSKLGTIEVNGKSYDRYVLGYKGTSTSTVSNLFDCVTKSKYDTYFTSGSLQTFYDDCLQTVNNITGEHVAPKAGLICKWNNVYLVGKTGDFPCFVACKDLGSAIMISQTALYEYQQILNKNYIGQATQYYYGADYELSKSVDSAFFNAVFDTTSLTSYVDSGKILEVDKKYNFYRVRFYVGDTEAQSMIIKVGGNVVTACPTHQVGEKWLAGLDVVIPYDPTTGLPDPDYKYQVTL